MDQGQLQRLVKHLNLTDYQPELEPYILTKEEEDRLIEHAIDAAKKHVAWKMRGVLKTEEEILLKLSQINWDEQIDRDEILKRANMVKNHEVWQIAQRKKENEEREQKRKELEGLWTAKRMYQLMAWTSQEVYGKKLIVHEGNKKLITALCYFVSRDDKFKTELGYDPQKGLLIRGATDLGKTYLVECLKNNPLNPILLLSMLEITEQIKKQGDFEIIMGSKRLIYFDDVGTEENMVKHFGTNMLFFKNFIEKYYFKNKTYNRLIASTNLNFKEMEPLYSFRAVRRIRAMFNVVDIEGKGMSAL
jgi:hypothetical protein